MRHPAFLNLQYNYGNPNLNLDVRPQYKLSAEGRRIDADTHLALLGVKIAGTGILGETEDKFMNYKR